MKSQILMLGFLVTYTSVALPECKAQSYLNKTDIQKQVVLSSSQLQQAMTEKSTEPSVEIKLVDMITRKPPMTELLMDVTLHNHYNQPCWFLLPVSIYSSTIKHGGVDGLEAYELRGKGRVVLGRFFGTGRFQAFLLPTGARLKIGRLPITLWGLENLDKRQVEVEVEIASQLTINGEPAEAWFGTNPMSDVQADVTADESRRLATREKSDFKEVPVSVVEKERFKVEVILFGDGKN